jgi:ABC-type transport system involved in multi-copper enzyme maturation permease subunit
MAETHLEVYRRFEGKLEERRLRFWPILGSGLRTALKQRRALLFLYGPPFIATVVFSFVVYLGFAFEEKFGEESPLERGGDLKEQLIQGMAAAAVNEGMKMLEITNQMIKFNQAMGFFALLVVAWFGSGLFCEDRKAGAHQLYFARPITRLDYFLGKFSIGSFFALCAMLVPMLVICIVAVFSSPDWSFLKEKWDVIPRAIGFSTLWSVIVVSLVLLASSLAGRRSFALIGVFAFFMLSAAIGEALGNLVGARWFALSLGNDVEALCVHIFHQTDQTTSVAPRDAWIAVLSLLAFSWLVIAARLRRLEVVA